MLIIVFPIQCPTLMYIQFIRKIKYCSKRCRRGGITIITQFFRLRLKEGAPKDIVEKFKKWKKERDEYEARWRLKNN